MFKLIFFLFYAQNELNSNLKFEDVWALRLWVSGVLVLSFAEGFVVIFNVQWGKKNIWSLLILYICPTDKEMVSL